MKNFAMITALILAATGAILLPARAQNAEDAAVRQAIEHYFRGHATGQGEHFRKVFHPDAKLFAVRDGKYWQRTSEEYISGAPGKPAADEAQRKRSIESVDISGNAAIAKIVLDYPQMKFTDYMSLLKIDGEWRIVNKTFYAEPKAKP
jgi:putative lumazine-binding protein